jgi:hypothetical protein
MKNKLNELIGARLHDRKIYYFDDEVSRMFILTAKNDKINIELKNHEGKLRVNINNLSVKYENN